MVWNKEESSLGQPDYLSSKWRDNSSSPDNLQELLDEAFDALLYLDEKLLNLEHSLDNQDLIRRVFGALIRLYGIFWSLRCPREFRMVAQAKALWSYIFHGAMPLERDLLRFMFSLGRSLEGHMVSLSQRTETLHPSMEAESFASRRRERDLQWSIGIQQWLEQTESMAMQRLSFDLESAEQELPLVLQQQAAQGDAALQPPGFSPSMDVSSLYTTLRELGAQMNQLREHLGTQMSSVAKQSLASMNSLYRFLRRGLRTLYSQSDDQIGLHGLIFSCREQFFLVPTSAWLDVLLSVQSTFVNTGSQRYVRWEQSGQRLPVIALDDVIQKWSQRPAKETLPEARPQWLCDTLELQIDMIAQATDSPFGENESTQPEEMHGYCVIVQGSNGPYALHVESITGEMMVALLEINPRDRTTSPIQATGLLPDARLVQILDASRLDQLSDVAHPLESC